MQIRMFTLSANTTEEEQERMNKFLRSHRILEVKQQYDETRGQWSFSVSYLDGEAPASIQLASSAFLCHHTKQNRRSCFRILLKFHDIIFRQPRSLHYVGNAKAHQL